MTTHELLRTVRLTPYRKGYGPTFTLRTWDTGDPNNGHHRLRYELRQHDNGRTTILFSGDDFGCSPLHAIDSDDTVAGILTFLTLRLGDTDSDYFDAYTTEQCEFRDTHAETLAAECFARWPKHF